MSLAVVHSHALHGLAAPEVRVEVHLANGLPSFTLVGLADTEVKEARERVRCALASCQFAFPHNKRVTVNLAPADLPKDSGRFDLAIALGILAASGQLDPAAVAPYAMVGELSLAGELRPIRGALALCVALTSQTDTPRTLVLPLDNASEAAQVPGARLRGARHLLEVVAALRHESAPPHEGQTQRNGDQQTDNDTSDPGTRRTQPHIPAVWPDIPPPVQPHLHAADAAMPADLSDVKGHHAARRALEIAAAGGHSLLMVGPPGSGKTMLAQRLPGLLPPLDDHEAMASAAVLSLAGHYDAARWRQRVMRAPHHSASAVALVGGGSPPRPGEVSLAHHGVLFLDELPEFPRSALEALREPMENGCITISRAARQAEFPARFQLIAAMNPCPCGYLGAPAPRSCRCSPQAVSRYQGRLSGPLLDRIDLQVQVLPVAPDLLDAAVQTESSSQVSQRVMACRARQLQRQACLNHRLSGAALQQHATCAKPAKQLLQDAARRLGWSSRTHHRVLRLARTIADLEGAGDILLTHMAEAIQYRRALPEFPS